nr:glycosyltransferase family 2 protein [uncultured Flavobacterium sp.]
MRQGFNPHKDVPQDPTEFKHQVVIPVYIPNQEGYFKDSFKNFQLCVESLFLTCHSKTFITIVNNGSCAEVKAYLNDLFETQKINELIHSENIGKLNAILKGVAGNNIELVTISDADVLFLENWQQETVAVFNQFPKAGVVGIVPQFRTFGHCCGNMIFDNLLTKKLKFKPVQNVEALKKFYHSIGWGEDYNPDYLKQILTIENGTHSAVVGSGHFVATYRKELFTEIPTYLGFKLGGTSERYLDEATLPYGLWRLTTNDNYAYHLGNVYEEWMTEVLNSFSKKENPIPELHKLSSFKKVSAFSYYLKNKLFIKFFNKRKYRRLFYQFIGLPKTMIQKY